MSKNCPKGFRWTACPDCVEFSHQSWLDTPKGKCGFNGMLIEDFLTIDERIEMLASIEKYKKWREDMGKGPIIDSITVVEDSRSFRELASRVEVLEHRMNPPKVQEVGKVGIEAED